MRTRTFSRAFATLFVAGLLAVNSSANAEPCNPIIDGTYCATQMSKKAGATSSSGTGMKAIDDMSSLVPSSAVRGGQSGTLVGISFRGKGSCFGLMRRSVCN